MPVYNSVLLFVVVAVAVADIVVGLVVLQRDNRSTTHRFFAGSAAALAFWLVVSYLSDQALPSHARLLFLNRLAVSAGIVAGMLLVAFSLTFPHRKAKIAGPWQLAFVPGGLLAAACMFTPLLVADVVVMPWGTNIVLGPLYLVLVGWEIAAMIALTANIVRRYRVASRRDQIQFRYLFYGLGGFFLAALLFTGILPYSTGDNHLSQLMPFATLLFLLPTAYAMLRYHLLDIGWPAVRGALYTLLVATVAALLVVLAGRWMDDIFSPLGVDSHLGFFIVGLAAILGFQPLRELIDAASDRVLHQRTYDPNAVLRQLGDVIATTLDPEAVASIVAHELSREMKLTFASVAFLRVEAPVIVSAGPQPPSNDLRELLDIMSAGRPVVADDLESDDPLRSAMWRCTARVFVPLSHDGQLLGAIVLGAKRSGRAFSERDLRFLEILANEAGAALRNATLFDERSQRVRELGALNQLAIAIGTDVELEAVLRNALEQAVEVTSADAGSIMLLDSDGVALEIAAAVGLPAEIVTSAHERLGEGVAGRVAQAREAVIIIDEADERFSADTVRPEVSSAISVPVVFKDEIVGVINLSRKDSPHAFTTENLNVVASFAGQLAVAIKNSRLYGDLERTFLGTISSLAAAVDAKDPYTFGHSTEVTEYADAIGVRMGLPESERPTLHIAATLHDIGKIGIDSATLRKPGKLDAEERAAMERHPSIAADILAPLDFLKAAVPLILFHHERYDGHGYPSGVSGLTIPLGARIISVADAFNAMVSDRPYRAGLPLEVAVQELRDNSGTQFDPLVVEAFFEVLAERGELTPPELRVVSARHTRSARSGAAESHAV